MLIANGPHGVEEVLSFPSTKNKYSKTNSILATISFNANLFDEGSAKNPWHIDIDLKDSGLVYESGGYRGV